MNSIVAQFDVWIQQLGAVGYLVLGAAALIEYVFPPFPGDTITLLGGVYAVRGERSWLLVLLVITAGSVAGAAVAYAVGRAMANRVDRQPEGSSFLGVSHARVLELQAKMRSGGAWMLVANRFVPAVRSLVFVAAGAARMPVGKVLGLGALSSLLWNVLILAAGIALGGNAERLEEFVRSYYRVVVSMAVVIGVVFVARYVFWGRPGTRGVPDDS